jgi:hypothetical protein
MEPMTVLNSRIEDNYWTGVWCDGDCGAFTVKDSTITGNGKNGIQDEISSGPAVFSGNTITGNGTLAGAHHPSGILIASSRNVDVYNNTFGNNTEHGVKIVEQGRTPGVANVKIHDNTINGDSMSGCTLSGVSCQTNSSAPETFIASAGPSGVVTSTSASFSFSSSETNATFECSLDGAAFGSCTSPKSYSALPSGHHSFRVRATDAAGNTEATPASRTWTVLKTFQESDRDHTRYGGWSFEKNPAFGGGYASKSNTAASEATVRFSGTTVTWKTAKRPDAGITDVFLDGTKVATFDGYSANAQYNVTGYSRSGLSSGNHTLRVVVTGTKNASSSGTYSYVDSFPIKDPTTTFHENSDGIEYDAWGAAKNTSASRGAYRSSTSDSQRASFFYFTGPRVDLIARKGPNEGTAQVTIVEKATDAVAKQETIDLTAATQTWQYTHQISGLDPAKSYYMYVVSSDGEPVVLDGYRAALAP